MFYNVDYMTNPAGIVSLMGHATEVSAKGAALIDGAARLLASGPNDIASLHNDVQVALWEYKAPKGTGMPADNIPQAIWDLLEPSKKTIKQDATAPKAPKVAKNKSKKNENNANKELQSPADGVTSPSPSDAVSTGDKVKDTKMAKAKKVAKKKVAKKAATPKTPKVAGMPREGTKKAKLLAAAQKSGGITLAEGQKITGWKQFRGTLGELAAAAKMKVVIHKDEEGKKATRWEVKK